MQSELSMPKDWNSKNKKYTSGKERRNSYHGQKKNRKRHNSYGRSLECKENLPEWMTHEGQWDMETQDPVKEFIRAIALDEGYGTCENTLADEPRPAPRVPDWADCLPRAREPSPLDRHLYAQFEAKFDRSIEALWAKDQNTPDDDYQDLPIDFQDLLSSPSDHLFADPAAEKCSIISLTESIWSVEAPESPGLHDRFRPLHIDDAPRPRDLHPLALYDGDDELYDALSSVAHTMRSYTAINHSRDRSGFAEVPPRRRPAPAAPAPRAPAPPAPAEREDLLTAARTHFRPIRREGAEPARHKDGDTFDIRGDLDAVAFRRSESGGLYLGSPPERYLEYRGARTIDYTRLNLTPAQRCPDLDDPAFRLRFPLRQRDAAAQTEREWRAPPACAECGGRAKKMRASAADSTWSEHCAPAPAPAAPARDDELSREWEELLRDISAAHRRYASEAAEGAEGDRKRRHSAAQRCAAACAHPHARFLHCAGALDRPLTR